eukprot:143511_1
MEAVVAFTLPLNKNKHKWITDWLISDEYKISALVVTSIQMVILPILFTLHAYRLYHGKNAPNHDKKGPVYNKYLIIDNLSLAAIALSFFSGMITISNYLGFFGQYTCRFMTITQNIFWLLVKVCIYIVVLLRLQCAFMESIFEINKIFMKTCFILIALFTIILILGSIMPHPIGVESFPLPPTNFCLLVIPLWLIVAPMVFDICCSTLSVYLFVNRIRKILIHTNKVSDLKRLLTKIVLISTIAIFSNLLSSIWFGVTDILFFTYLDAFVNPVCLILMQIHHNDIYLFLCKCCHRSVGKIMNLTDEKSLNVNNSTRTKCAFEISTIESKAGSRIDRVPSASIVSPPTSPDPDQKTPTPNVPDFAIAIGSTSADPEL